MWSGVYAENATSIASPRMVRRVAGEGSAATSITFTRTQPVGRRRRACEARGTAADVSDYHRSVFFDDTITLNSIGKSDDSPFLTLNAVHATPRAPNATMPSISNLTVSIDWC